MGRIPLIARQAQYNHKRLDEGKVRRSEQGTVRRKWRWAWCPLKTGEDGRRDSRTRWPLKAGQGNATDYPRASRGSTALPTP